MVERPTGANRNWDDASPSLVRRLSSFRETISGNAGGVSFFAQSSVPSFILHLPSGGFVDVNESFCSCFSYSRERILDAPIRASELVEGDGRDLLKLARRFPERIPDDRFVVQCSDQKGGIFAGSVSVDLNQVQGENLVFGTVRDISEGLNTKQELQEQLEAAKQSNKQVRTLMDKIRNITDVTSKLLTVRHEVGVLTKARSILCDRNGMNFENVSFFMLNESSDAVEQPFRDEAQDPIPLSEPHPAVKVVTGESDVVRVETNVLCLPLQGSDERFGAMFIQLNPEESSLMEEDQLVWKGFREALSILANLVGLIIHNCRLAQDERQASIHDPLTGVYNRRYFNRTLQQEVSRAKRYDYPLSLMIIDVDNFKEINDSYGHQEGDRLIQQCVRTLEQGSRQSDILCRFGGDEFALVLPSTEGEEAEQLAHRLEQRFESSRFTVNTEEGPVEEIPVRVSIGIGTLPENVEETIREDSRQIDETGLLRIADRCMFQAKEADHTRIQRMDLSDGWDGTE